MKTLYAALMLLGMSGAMKAGETISPAAPQFFAISTPDAETSARWYREAFGLALLDVVRPPGDNGFAMILRSDRLLLEIVQAKGSSPPPPANRHLTQGIFKVGFHVADLDAAVARLRAMKAVFDTGVIDDTKHDFRFVLVRDPDGNMLQLFERKPG